MKKIKYLFLVLIVTTCFVIGNVIINAVSPFYNITGLYLNNNSVSAGDKLYVELYMIQKDESTSITGTFDNGSNSTITLQLKDILSNPYFEIPSNLQPDTKYTLTSLTVSDSKGTITYSMVEGGQNYMNPLSRNYFNVKSQQQLQLGNFELVGDSTLTPENNITFNLTTPVNCSYISVVLRDRVIPTISHIIYLENVSGNTYRLNSYTMPDDIVDGEYYISDIFLFHGGNGSPYHYSNYSRGNDVIPLSYYVGITVSGFSKTEQENTDTEFLNNIEIKIENVKLNEKVNVVLDTKKMLTSATLIFSNETESMTVNVKDLNTSEPYFVVPFTTSAGTYNLDYAILKDNDGNEYQYRKGEDYYTIKHFDFNSTLTVENQIAEGNLLNLDNSKITADIIEKIKDLDSNIVIEINAEEDPVVSKELFSAIQNSNKTLIFKYKDLEWTFNGLDIQNPKMIDVSTNIYNVSKDEKISSKVQNGLVLDFAANNELPGKCLIKVYNSDTIAKIINKDNANIYYYNEATDKFEVIKLNAEYNTNGYYEFYISHNSKYVITTDNIDSKYVTETAEENTMDVKTILTIAIPSAIILILLIVIIVLIVKVKKAKNNE